MEINTVNVRHIKRLMDVVANQSRYFLEIGARVIFNAKFYVADFWNYFREFVKKYHKTSKKQSSVNFAFIYFRYNVHPNQFLIKLGWNRKN